MTPQAIDELVDAAFPDATAAPEGKASKLRKQYPQAIGFRQRGNDIVVVFEAVGEHFAEVDLEAIKRAKQDGVVPVVVAAGKGIRAIGPHFRKLKAHVICEVAGTATIIEPLSHIRGTPRRPQSDTRVPVRLLVELSRIPTMPAALVGELKRLVKEYKRIARRETHRDSLEAEALMEFARVRLIELGLEAHRLAGTAFIRSLEQAGLGGKRDHFFHSFQNYFLGLHLVAACLPQFSAFKDAAHVHWQVDPFAVWFLCAMWHDVGYAHQKVQSFLKSAYGEHLDDSVATNVRAAFIEQEKTSQGTRCIASLMARLLNPENARTEWGVPSDKTKLNPIAQKIYNAILENLQESHGAFGGIRLYRDYAESIDSMEEEQRQVAQQTVLLAAVSMPFHDWKFRRAVRKAIRVCQIPIRTLPFAALLAFVDSIQDDRRDLEGVLDTPVILRALSCTQDGIITADVDLAALDSQSTLEKIIEGRDVHASLVHCEGGMRFVYPIWIVA